MTSSDGSWSRRRLLVWGKTYPEFSRAYYETVCTGAVDGETGKLVRIYPISLRYLDKPFPAYHWIEADVQKNSSDFRPESFRIRQDTIEVLDPVGSEKGSWSERKKWILRPGNTFRSVEDLKLAEVSNHTSLGLIKPKSITRIYSRRKPASDKLEWEEHRKQALLQRELFVDAETKTKDLAYMPVQYRVCFNCDDPSCTAEHDFAVLDWGLYVLHRKEFAKGGASHAEKSTIAMLNKCLDPVEKDAYLFLGNSKAHCQTFSVAGMFYPKKPVEKAIGTIPNQTTLPGF